MGERVYTISTRLETKSGLAGYLDKFSTEYGKLRRKMFYDINKGVLKTQTLSTYISGFMLRNGILKRTANSIRYDIMGKTKALLALKKTQLKELKYCIKNKEQRLNELRKVITELKPKVRDNKATEKQLQKYRNARISHYYLCNKINFMYQKLEKLQNDIAENCVQICFGGKKLYKKQYNLKENGYKTHKSWYKHFVKERDGYVYYVGSTGESCGNQIVQLYYDKQSDTYMLKMRKEKAFCTSNREQDKYIIVNGLQFKYMSAELQDVLENNKALTYTFVRKRCSWYMLVSFSKAVEETTRYNNGVIGLDYNVGFIQAVETNSTGNMVDISRYDLQYHGTGNKAKTEIETVVSRIVKGAQSVGKDIVIEELDFRKKKAERKYGKRCAGYNRMLHTFDYSRYSEKLRNSCNKYGVHCITVSAVDTTKIGYKRYGESRKLNRHQAAAYVIGRRGQGYVDAV